MLERAQLVTRTVQGRDHVLSLNASAMAVQVYIGGEHEHQSIGNLVKVVDAGNRHGIPTLAVTGVGKELARDAKYLDELRSAVAKAGGAIVNIAVDGEHSPYAMEKAEREKGIAFSKQWIDIAASVGSPSVRTNMPPAKDSKPEVGRAAESLLRVAEYGSAKNIVVNLENDNPVSEDPFFIVKIIEKVNSPWLHANPDFANTLAGGKTAYPYEGIAAMFKHAYGICHVKAMEADEKGQLVHVDLAKTFGILKSTNYKGYCSMEFDSPGDPYQGTSDLIEKTLQYLS